MKTLINAVKTAYVQRFAGQPIIVFAPGRVNLIGEHTDYNLGFVLPAAIDKAIVLAMSTNESDVIRLQSIDMTPSYIEVPLSQPFKKSETNWVNYIIGVVDELQKDGHVIGGFDCVFGGNLPIGAGMSSSAALEGGVAYGLSEIFGVNLSLLEMTRVAQRAENLFVDVQCGIMDQFASLHGKKNSIIQLDCRSLEYEYYPFEWDDVCLLLCDTKVRRALAGSEYNNRRQQCEEGVHLIQQSYPQVKSLRDVTIEMLEEHKNSMNTLVYRRCHFVLSENRRVTDACEYLVQQNLVEFGAKMYQSHFGLRDEYEVSCIELDILVEATETLDGVLGSRMMGGGFGGCTINLVKKDSLESITNQVGRIYTSKTGITPDFHVVNIGQGTHLVSD